ncbi:MAG: hypothetical protein ACRCSN_04475, partial [Dermatophilaceae bacterium]
LARVEQGGDGAPQMTEPEPSPPGEGAGEGDGAPATDAAPVLGVAIPILAAVGLLLIAAAIVFVLLRRRRRTPPPFDDSQLGGDTSAAWMVDRALRVLVASCEHHGVPVPGVFAVHVEGAVLRLRLVTPTAPAPPPFVGSDDGMSWTAPLDRLQREPASESSLRSFARLITLGVADFGRVLVDLRRARGIIAVDGPLAARHQVLRRWLAELASNPWSDHPRIVLVGAPAEESSAAVEHIATLEQMLPEFDGGGGVLVLSQAPSSSQQAELASRFASPRFEWIVIVLDSVPSARWRFQADGSGRLRSDFLPELRLVDRPAAASGA